MRPKIAGPSLADWVTSTKPKTMSTAMLAQLREMLGRLRNRRMVRVQ